MPFVFLVVVVDSCVASVAHVNYDWRLLLVGVWCNVVVCIVACIVCVVLCLVDLCCVVFVECCSHVMLRLRCMVDVCYV